MKKILLGIVLIIVLVPVLAVAAVFTGLIKTPHVAGIASRWGEVTHNSTQVTTDVDLDNPNSFGVSLGSLSADVDIDLNGVQLGHGVAADLKLPAGRSTTSIVTTIDNTKIPDWWAAHINAQEKTQVHILPRATINLVREFVINGPAINREFATDLLANASSTQPEKMAAGPFNLTLVRRSFQWGTVTPQNTNMDALLVLRNDGTFPIPLVKLAFTVNMNAVVVAQGESLTGPIILTPGKEVEVPVQVGIDNVKLLDWWPTHIAANEVTQYAVRLEGVLEADLPIVGLQRLTVPLVTFSDELKTNVLGQ